MTNFEIKYSLMTYTTSFPRHLPKYYEDKYGDAMYFEVSEDTKNSVYISAPMFWQEVLVEVKYD